MAYPPHARQSLPRAWKRSCLRPASVAPCFVLQKNKKPLGTSRENALLERKKNRCMGAQARKEGLQQTRGHWTTRRQLPTASTNAYGRAGDSCMAGTLVFRGRLLEFSPSALRRSGAGGREERSLALVAKVAVMQLCSYDESPTRRFSTMSLSRRSPFKECHAHTHVLWKSENSR